jgi:hypothetical protein
MMLAALKIVLLWCVGAAWLDRFLTARRDYAEVRRLLVLYEMRPNIEGAAAARRVRRRALAAAVGWTLAAAGAAAVLEGLL